MKHEKLLDKLCNPPVLEENERYILKFAETELEEEKAKRLRYEVFNLEQGKGLNKSEGSGIDSDEYDPYCRHIIVIAKENKKLVGTYRIMPGIIARQEIGFYSSREFDISGLDEIIDSTVEVGRSCVSMEYRSGSVIGLLWTGLGTVLSRGGFDYLFGCVSLDEKQVNEAWAIHKAFACEANESAIIIAKPRKSFALKAGNSRRIEELKTDRQELIKITPPLLKGYMRLGSEICSEPALDKEFGTIDFLILMEMGKMPKKYYKHFCEGKK